MIKFYLHFIFGILFGAGVALLLIHTPIGHADETITDVDSMSRIYSRDRGSRNKALINDRGEKVGYGVKRGDDWVYFVDDRKITISEDE